MFYWAMKIEGDSVWDENPARFENKELAFAAAVDAHKLMDPAAIIHFEIRNGEGPVFNWTAGLV